VQAYPESLLAKLADNEDDGVMEEKGDAIRLDRDPAVFAHVLQRFMDKPLEAVEPEALCKELDFYGAPSSTMPPASALADMWSRHAENVVTSILDQMAVLTVETLPDAVGEQLVFYLSKPTDRWSEVKVRLHDTWTAADKYVDPLPPHIQQPLETRLRSLGYTVSIGRVHVRVNNQWVITTTITLSWADK
jgi:hypothetical protein